MKSAVLVETSTALFFEFRLNPKIRSDGPRSLWFATATGLESTRFEIAGIGIARGRACPGVFAVRSVHRMLGVRCMAAVARRTAVLGLILRLRLAESAGIMTAMRGLCRT